MGGAVKTHHEGGNPVRLSHAREDKGKAPPAETDSASKGKRIIHQTPKGT